MNLSFLNRKTFIISILLLSTFELFSKDIKFEKIDMNKGLSHNSALCMAEDHDGFVWIGTRDGLNRFDGKNNIIYKHIFNDSTSLVNNQINCLFETSGNEFWIGTSNGLTRYQPDSDNFLTYRLFIGRQNAGYIWSIEETADKNLWVGTTQGIFIIDEFRKSYRHLYIDPNPAGNANTILKILQDNNGRIWIGTRNGLFLFENDRFKRIYFDILQEQSAIQFTIRDIQQGSDGLIWIATENNGVYGLSLKNDSVEINFRVNNNTGLNTNTARKIFIEEDKNIWIGTIEGLVHYNCAADLFESYTNSPVHPESISNNSIRDIMEDSEGGFWIATYSGGVNYYNPLKNIFKHYMNFKGPDNKTISNVISVFLEDVAQNIWIGTEGGGLFYFDCTNDSVIRAYNTSNSRISNNNIKSLAFGEPGKLWIGTFNGLNCLDIATGKVLNYFNNSGNSGSLSHNQVHALYFENEEKLWVGTNGGGVQLLNPKTSSFTNIEGTGHENVNVFYADESGKLWVGCQNQIFAVQTSLLEVIPVKNLIENPAQELTNVTFITGDTGKRLWIGSRGNGLFNIKNNRLTWFNTTNGLPDNTVNALLEGNDSSVWITTNKGLSKIDFKQNKTGQPEIISETYSIEEGLQGLQFYPNSAVKSRSGNLFFGGINGFNKFIPNEITEKVRFPNLILTELKIKYKSSAENRSPLLKNINETSALNLEFSQNDFTLSFTGINFINPEKTVYRYRVEGLDNNWNYLGKQSVINFTYFPVGTFEIQIQASTNPEKWGEKYRSLGLTVLPPWWRTWWALLIYILFLVILLVIFFYYSQKWAKIKNQLAMEHFQREKENEMHRLKLKFFTDVSHELRTPLTMIIAPLERLVGQHDLPEKFMTQLTQIKRNSYKMMQLINQVLDLRKLETGHERLMVAEGNIIRFLKEISLAFQELANTKNIDFKFHPHQPEFKLWYDRNKLEMVLNNLLSNALKFAPKGGIVQLAVSEISRTELTEHNIRKNTAEKYLCISVIDNGPGIQPEVLKNIFERFYSENGISDGNIQTNTGVGLELAKRLVELHKGYISVKSLYNSTQSPGFTQFRVYLPIGKNSYNTEEIDLAFKNSEDLSQYTQIHFSLETPYNLEDEKEIEEEKNTGQEKQTMLVVEDNAEVRRFINDLFKNEFEVTEAEDGKDGLDKAFNLCPDIVISDIMMPVMDGMELCKRLKTDPRTSHIPVILLTARTALTFQFQGIETGADDYITKPFNSNYLLVRVKNLIRQRKLMQSHFKRELIFEPGNYTVTSVDEKLLQKAMNYINENMADTTISVEKLSAELGLSRVHFYRKIKSLTNLTAVEFIRSIRLKRAAQLLQQQKFNINEVRQMVGFDDADYFRECFKNQFGVNPSQYTADEPKP